MRYAQVMRAYLRLPYWTTGVPVILKDILDLEGPVGELMDETPTAE